MYSLNAERGKQTAAWSFLPPVSSQASGDVEALRFLGVDNHVPDATAAEIYVGHQEKTVSRVLPLSHDRVYLLSEGGNAASGLRDRVRGRRCAEKNLAGFPVARNSTISLSFSMVGPCCICSRSLRTHRPRRLRETANLCASSKLIATYIGR